MCSATTRTQICNFGAPSPVVLFLFSQGFLCNSVRKSPQNMEKIARFRGVQKTVESCHVSGCHVFFSLPTKFRELAILKTIRLTPLGFAESTTVRGILRTSRCWLGRAYSFNMHVTSLMYQCCHSSLQDYVSNSPRLLCQNLKDQQQNKGAGRGRGPPDIIQKFRLRKWPILSADFPMTTLALFGKRILGQCPAAASSPGPFVYC